MAVDGDVDVYFAQHDVANVVSDMLFELGFHRPKEVGKFISSYIGRRYNIEAGQGDGTGGLGSVGQDALRHEDYSTVQIFHSIALDTSVPDMLACSLLEEARALRQKYSNFEVHDMDKGADVSAEEKETAASFAVIPWHEFRTDFERMLTIFSSSQLWDFCNTRLSVLESLFTAHSALNANAEAAEVFAAPPRRRVDRCVQLARCLPPTRLMAVFRKRVSEAETSSTEVCPGVTLTELAAKAAAPTPASITADVDSPLPGTSTLAGVVSRTANFVRGEFLAEIVKESFRLLEKTSPDDAGEVFAEYRLPLYAETGAWIDLTRWILDLEVASPRVKWVVQLPQMVYSEMKEQRTVLNFGELLDNLFGPPAAAAQDPDNPDASRLGQVLEKVAAVEVASVQGADEAFTSACSAPPKDWTFAANPPCVYQMYHVWARLKALNGLRTAARLPQLPLTCAANTAEPLVAAYVLGAESVSRCGALATHAPLRYLMMLDRVTAMVSLTSQRSLSGAGTAGMQAFLKLFRSGVPVALCTEDPSVSQQAGGALDAEYAIAQGAGLSIADLDELACASVRRATADDEEKFGRKKRAIRERYRESRRDAEVALLERLAQRGAMTNNLGSMLKE